MSKISSTRFGQSFAHLQEHKTEILQHVQQRGTMCHVAAFQTPAYYNTRTLYHMLQNLSLTLLKMGKRLPETCWADLGHQ